MYVFIPMLKLYFERLMTLLLGLDILKNIEAYFERELHIPYCKFHALLSGADKA